MPVVAPGSVVEVRDEEWLVTSLQQTAAGNLLQVEGLSELVRGTTATFYDTIDDISVHDPADARLVADPTSGYRRARLWLESTIRKTPVPLSDPALSVSTSALADPLEYQRSAVRRALDPENLRPRILLADAVGLGKTIEIGMILSELARRGRADRVLIVCPRHVLEQMQQELWTRFALAFVRLDSVGVQRVRQEIPATRNPFTYFQRVIISMDTLKQDQFLTDLRRHHWDAVVIDESHNVTNTSAYNNRLARTVAERTDALILASATPHNGKKESFAELIRLLEPTAVTAAGELVQDEIKRLVVRRHRHSAEVADVVGADWAERLPLQHFRVEPSDAERAVAEELDQVWLHPESGTSPYSGKVAALFPWTLAKAFLSSPAAVRSTVRERLGKLTENTAAVQQERAALTALATLNDACYDDRGGKYARLVAYLREVGVGRRSPERAVVFAERVATLDWLAQRLRRDLSLPEEAVEILHGGLSDETQQQIVDSFKQASSPIRVLVTGDVASEGVNLHAQCHELIHYDIPWSLIRIEQRNGRIDRYGQKHRPQITTLLLDPQTTTFSGDIRVLARLLEREETAHRALGDAGALMGEYSAKREEEAIRKMLAERSSFEETVPDVKTAAGGGSLTALLEELMREPAGDGGKAIADRQDSLYPDQVDFLREALVEVFGRPDAEPATGGVCWREFPDHGLVQLQPPRDLRQRLRVLPQSYLAERKVDDELKLAVTRSRGQQSLAAALADEGSSWPEAHYLAPLHPVLDWAADRALATLNRNEVFVVRGDVQYPTVLILGTLTNRRGQLVSSTCLSVAFPDPDHLDFAPISVFPDVRQLVASVGFSERRQNPGPVAGVEQLQPLVRRAVEQGQREVEAVTAAAATAARDRIESWQGRVESWTEDAGAHVQRSLLKERRVSVEQEAVLASQMTPDRALVRPLLVVVPADHPTESGRAA